MKRLVFITALVLAVPAFAQSVVGTSVVDGKIVQLFSDGTWRAETTGKDANCVGLGSDLQFCPTDPAWKQIRASTPQVDATFQYDDRHYGQFVVEAIGTADGLTAEGFRAAVLGNAEAATGKAPTTLGVTPTEVAGLPGETVTYLVEFQGTQFLFATTTLLTDKVAAQIQTWQLGGLPYTDAHQKLHAEFLTSTSFVAPANE